MIFGMEPFTFAHVVLSLLGIASGFVVIFGMLKANRLDGLTMFFLATTVATSATGFFLPAPHFLPSHAIGIISLVVLAIAILARYTFHMAGAWRKTFVITAVIAQYLNVFVLVVQLFLKVPSLHDLAPTQSEPPFLVTQLVVMALFIVLGIRAAMKFRDRPLRAMSMGSSR
jgi:hypothetical protein